MSEGSKIIEVYKEIIALLHRVDDKYDTTKEELHKMQVRITAFETGNGLHKEEIERIKQSLIKDFQDIDDNFEKWDKIWSKNKNYVYFAVTLSMIGASATLGFDFVIELLKKVFGIK